MIRIAYVLTGAVLGVVARGAVAAEPLIWVNEHATRNWAKTACESVRAERGGDVEIRVACVDPEGRAQHFLQELRVQLAVLAECKGISFTLTPPAHGQKRWELRINMLPGAQTQAWYIEFGGTGELGSVWFMGEGTAPQIAATACRIALGRGAKSL